MHLVTLVAIVVVLPSDVFPVSLRLFLTVNTCIQNIGVDLSCLELHDNDCGVSDGCFFKIGSFQVPTPMHLLIYIKVAKCKKKPSELAVS